MPTSLIPEVTTEVKLDVACEALPLVIPTKQLDNVARTLQISMYDSRTDAAVTIPSGLRAEFHVRRPDGVLIEYSQPITIEDNVVTVGLIESCLAVAGKALADLKLYEDDKVFSAASFALDIQKTATASQSETRGILTKANLEIISAEGYSSLSTKETNTLYIITDGKKISICLGDLPLEAGSAQATGETVLNLTGTATPDAIGIAGGTGISLTSRYIEDTQSEEDNTQPEEDNTQTEEER